MGAPARRIWVTRTLPQAVETAERLAALGLEPIVAPVLQVLPIDGARLELEGVEALAFTSLHAVAAAARLSARRELAVFAVGDATAAAARAAEYASVASANGDVRALVRLIAAAEPRPSRVLVPSARAPAADLAALLAAEGVAASSVAVYEATPVQPLPAPDRFDAVLVHSPRAAELVAAHLAGQARAARIDAYAISPAAAAPLAAAGLRSVRAAARPTEVALLALLEP